MIVSDWKELFFYFAVCTVVTGTVLLIFMVIQVIMGPYMKKINSKSPQQRTQFFITCAIAHNLSYGTILALGSLFLLSGIKKSTSTSLTAALLMGTVAVTHFVNCNKQSVNTGPQSMKENSDTTGCTDSNNDSVNNDNYNENYDNLPNADIDESNDGLEEANEESLEMDFVSKFDMEIDEKINEKVNLHDLTFHLSRTGTFDVHLLIFGTLIIDVVEVSIE